MVRCIKKIELQDSTAKALIFSTWSSLLDIIAQALYENGIAYRQLTGSKLGSKYENDLFRFVYCFRCTLDSFDNFFCVLHKIRNGFWC